MKAHQLLISALLFCCLTPFATAHIVLAHPRAAAGSHYKAVFQISHGCGGSPTNKITVQVPDGVSSVKPMPKPGWSLSVHGESAVSWSGGTLVDAHYDEFVMLIKLPARPGTAYFKVVQECEKGRQEWVQVPGQDKPAAGIRYPAPALTIEPAAIEHAHH